MQRNYDVVCKVQERGGAAAFPWSHGLDDLGYLVVLWCVVVWMPIGNTLRYVWADPLRCAACHAFPTS